jgi:hypothetical protein
MTVHQVIRAAAAGTFALLLLSDTAWAQQPPLAEVARKEQERRKATKPATKVLTNKDLPSVTSPAPIPPPELPAAAEPPAPEPQKPGEPEKDEAWWRARITGKREALSRAEVLLEALQSRVNGLSADFVNRDDPYQRAKVGEDRQKALAEMERTKADIEGYKKQIEDIEEEARKAGVPPGWLR